MFPPSRPASTGRIARMAVASLLAVSCRPEGAPPTPAVPVSVVTVERRDVPFTVDANGTVEPQQSVAVQAQVTGMITRVGFREGDDVQAGQLLFEIDPRPYEAALAEATSNLTRSQVQAAIAERDVERSRELVAKDFITRQQFDQLEAQAAAQRATVDANQAALQRAELNLQFARIRSPISGRAGGLLVRAGNLVRANSVEPLVVVNQIRPILVRFAIPAALLPEVRRYRGNDVVVSATPAGASTAVQGQLDFIDNAVDTATGTIMLKGRFGNADGVLWPGQFVAVRMQLFVEHGATVVPARAVVAGQQGSYVFTVDSGTTAVLRPVKVARLADSMAVISEGVDAGAQVVVDGQLRLRPGTKVEIKGS